MAEFDEAYFKKNDKLIKVEDYMEKVHYQKLYCPECHLAPIHIVKKQKTTYYAANRKNQHSKDCQYYSEFIANRNLINLLNSQEVEDIDRLKFLIKSNLESALKNLLKNSYNSLNNSLSNFRKDANQKAKVSNGSNYERFSIPRVKIKNVYRKKEDLIGSNIVIWGVASIESRSYERKNGATGEIFKVKDLIFSENEKYRFKIQLTGFKLSYYKELPNNPMTIGFAVFGLLTEHNGFLVLKIQSTKHLEYLI